MGSAVVRAAAEEPGVKVVGAVARPGTASRGRDVGTLSGVSALHLPLRDDFSATFTTSLMEKDVDLVLEAADAAGVGLPLAGELKALLHSAIEAGYGDDDFMALFLHLRGESHQEVLR